MADLTAALSAHGTTLAFHAARDRLRLSTSGTGAFGPVTLDYVLSLHLAGGAVTLTDKNTIEVRELDIVWDELRVGLGIDVPTVSVGGFCLLPNPLGGCLVRAPRLSLFTADPDLRVPLDLGGWVRSEISLTAAPVVRYWQDPDRPAGAGWLEAREAGHPDQWRLYLVPDTVDVDPFDVSDMVADLIRQAVTQLLSGVLAPLPGWARDLVASLLGGATGLLEDILDLPDDIAEWLGERLGTSLGLLDTIGHAVLDHFATQAPLLRIEDPFPLLEARPVAGTEVSLVPVVVPLTGVEATVDAAELVLSATIGEQLP